MGGTLSRIQSSMLTGGLASAVQTQATPFAANDFIASQDIAEGTVEELNLAPAVKTIIRSSAKLLTGIKQIESAFQREMTIPILLKPGRRHELLSRRRTLVDEWQQVAEALYTLIWDSREIAGEAQAILSDFLNVFMPRLEDQDVSLEVKLAELRDYSQALFEEHTTRAQRVADSFIALRARTVSIGGRWTTLALSYRIERKYARLFAALEDIDSRITAPPRGTFDGKGVHFLVAALTLVSINTAPFLLDDMSDLSFIHRPASLATQILALSYMSVAVRVDLQRFSAHVENQAVSDDWIAVTILHPELSIMTHMYNHIHGVLVEYQVSVVLPHNLPTAGDPLIEFDNVQPRLHRPSWNANPIRRLPGPQTNSDRQ
ncbi:hypothetical protein EIP91_006718 [Steccherinum ochraceum]|uniref:Uncharacterized protein n=1 Tax=Steccherinum ochraceum TaxID=92696 RepID=A0A4R0RFW4_9APHY|nr:hypothetical protein EIP91_006718 [Steccherinum ochraceum]